MTTPTAGIRQNTIKKNQKILFLNTCKNMFKLTSTFNDKMTIIPILKYLKGIFKTPDKMVYILVKFKNNTKSAI